MNTPGKTKVSLRFDRAALIFALIVCFLSVLGQCAFFIVIREENNFLRNGAVYFLSSVFLALLAYLLCTVLYKKLDRLQLPLKSNAGSTGAKTKKENTIKKAWKSLTNWSISTVRAMTLIMLICWLPYLFIRFPGNYDPDTQWQILQTYGLCPLTDHHPVFDTFLFGMFWKLGDLFSTNQISLLLYALLQMFITAVSTALCLNYLKRQAVPASVIKAALLFYALYPPVPMFAQVMAKDMLHGAVLMLYMAFYLPLVFERGEKLSSRKEIFCFFMLLILLMLTKKTGIYFVVLTTLPLLFYLKSNRIRCLSAVLAAVFLFTIGFNGILLPKLNIPKGGQQEMLSVPAQQTAYLLKQHGSEMNPEELETISAVYYQYEALPAVYVPVRADATKALWRNDATADEKQAYFRWYLKQYLRYPADMILSLAALDCPLLCVDTVSQGNESLIFYYDNIPSRADPEYGMEDALVSWSGGMATKEQVHEVFSTSYRFPLIKLISRAFNYLYRKVIRILAPLFSKVLFATWIPLLILIYGISRKRTELVLLCIPTIVCTAFLAVGPIVLPRYMVSSVYLAALTLAATAKGVSWIK